MKKIHIFLLMLFTFSINAFGQVGINTDQPNTKAGLHVSERMDPASPDNPDKFNGVIIQRYTTAERNTFSLTAADAGLTIFNKDENCYNYWDGSLQRWRSLCGKLGAATLGAFDCDDDLELNGAYRKGTALTAAEYMEVTVDVTEIGIYDFKAYSTPVNGYHFSATGEFTSTGVQTVIMYGTGVPVNAQADTFKLTLNGTEVCDVLVNVVDGAELTVDCDASTVAGKYVVGTALNSTNYIDLRINAAATGPWSASTNTVDGFSFSGSGNITSTGSQTVRLTVIGTPPTSNGIKEFNVTINGKTCKINITVVMIKNVLIIGKPTHEGNFEYVFMNHLQNDYEGNFGVNGKSKVEVNWVRGPQFLSNATQLIDLINNNKIEVILAGDDFDASEDMASVIADFIKNKKGFFFQVQSNGQGTYLKRILDKAYGTNVTFSNENMPIYAAIMPDIDTPVLNGVFGDMRNKYVRSSDNYSWIGITPGTVDGLNSLVQLPASGTNAARNTFINAPGFFMFPHWGMTNDTGSTYGSGDAAPIGFSTGNFTTGNMWNGSAYVSTNIPAGNIGNWVLLGNILDMAFTYAHENAVPDYQVDTNYSN